MLPFPPHGAVGTHGRDELHWLDPRAGRLRDILGGEAMHMVFQPIVDLRDGSIAGAEALARFELEPRRTPDLWFAEAWELGLGMELELHAIRCALTHLGELPPHVYLAVNAGPGTLCCAELHELLAQMPGDRIVVELTEHVRVDDYTPLQTAITRLRTRGTRLAIDDAGAGFSSFQHVLRLRPDIIKLDRSLTSGVDTNPVRFALASALATFAGTLGARVCAEGIETQGELAALQRIGVEHGQGFLLARPQRLPLTLIAGEPWASAPRRTAPSFLASPVPGSHARLDALARTGLMDSDAEECFDRLTRLATRKLGVPVSIVSRLDDHRQFFKGSVGLPEPLAGLRQTPLEYSLCRHVVTLRS
ncbi:MAG: EAL domain-containing protein, partial [Deltaproteobacteria bacterium]|nr:EAL domain-containing protein [Nannocystaceae bacterium]